MASTRADRAGAAGFEAFFDLPAAEKLGVLRPAPDVTRGYIPLEAESVGQPGADLPGDLNESLMIGPVDATADAPISSARRRGSISTQPLARSPAALRGLYEAYFRAMGALAAELMAMFALALDLPEGFFADKLDRHISRLRVSNYPAPLVPPKPGQLRAGAHCDYGSLTILRAEDKPGGLQVLNRAGDWVDVPIAPDSYIVNIGELMARWTNERWPRPCTAWSIRPRPRPPRRGACRWSSSTTRLRRAGGGAARHGARGRGAEVPADHQRRASARAIPPHPGRSGMSEDLWRQDAVALWALLRRGR